MQWGYVIAKQEHWCFYFKETQTIWANNSTTRKLLLCFANSFQKETRSLGFSCCFSFTVIYRENNPVLSTPTRPQPCNGYLWPQIKLWKDQTFNRIVIKHLINCFWIISPKEGNHLVFYLLYTVWLINNSTNGKW